MLQITYVWKLCIQATLMSTLTCEKKKKKEDKWFKILPEDQGVSWLTVQQINGVASGEFINRCFKVPSRPVSFFFFFFCVCQRSLRMFSSLSSRNKVKLIGVREIKITPVGHLSLPETAEIAQRSDVISGSHRVANIQSPSLWGIIAACFLHFGPKEV